MKLRVFHRLSRKGNTFVTVSSKILVRRYVGKGLIVQYQYHEIVSCPDPALRGKRTVWARDYITKCVASPSLLRRRGWDAPRHAGWRSRALFDVHTNYRVGLWKVVAQ